MNVKLCTVITAACLGLAAPAVQAGRITVDVTARVSQIYDPGNVLGGQVTIGQTGSGSYSYETSVANSNTWSSWVGTYPQSNTQASTAFTLGSLVFESDPASPQWYAEVSVWDYPYNTGASDQVRINASPNKPVPGLTAGGTNVGFQFADYNGSVLQSVALPTGALSLTSYPWSQVYVSGWNDSYYFEVRLDIESAQMGGGADAQLTVSPAAGIFVRQQPIVPALLLPGGTMVVGVEGSINGSDMPWYFSSCYSPGNPTRTVFICPDINSYLTGGVNRVEWRVRLGDGSVAAKVMEWEMAQ